MTGEEYWNLKRGDIVKVVASFYKYNVGDLLRVEYIDSMHGNVYLRNFNEPLGKQIKKVELCDVMINIDLSEKPLEETRNQILLPFAIGDEVWIMANNEAKKGRITNYKIQYDRSKGSVVIDYWIKCLDYIEDIEISSKKCFGTKEELIKSL